MDSEQRRPTEEATLQFRGRIVLPLEGKGDRSVVDEVHLPDIASLASIWAAHCPSPRGEGGPLRGG